VDIEEMCGAEEGSRGGLSGQGDGEEGGEQGKDWRSGEAQAKSPVGGNPV
jgi:hypothetical protein